jgi:hypothetical protein
MPGPLIELDHDAAATAAAERTQASSQDDAVAASSKTFLHENLESLARITFAGSGGSLAGLALERNRRQFPQREPPNMHHYSEAASKGRFPTSPPRPPAANLPLTWAFSCMIFVSVIEVSRRASPMTTLLDALSSADDRTAPFSKYQRVAIVATGDYAIGGTVAGLATTVARKLPMLWGLRVGLGLVAGIVQAGVEVGELYLLRQKSTSREGKFPSVS